MTKSWVERATSVPRSLWAYAFFRATAFGAPLFTEEGSVGLGLIVVLALYIPLLRRSRAAWAVLVLLDSASLAITLLSASIPDDVPYAAPGLAAAALICLFWPSAMRYVAGDRAGRNQRHVGDSA